MCGASVVTSANYCSTCGSPQSNSEIQPPTEDSQSKRSTNIGNWIMVGLFGAIGLVALESALTMPTQAEYVTFAITFDNLMYGGWYTWYSGLSALAMEIQGGGMKASTLRLILWATTGFSFSLIFQIFKKR